MSFPNFSTKISLKCPSCQSKNLREEDEHVTCLVCGKQYDKELLIEQNSDYIRAEFLKSTKKDLEKEIAKQLTSSLKGVKFKVR